LVGPVSAMIQFPIGDGASSVAKQRHQDAVPMTEWQLADTNVLQSEWVCKQ